MFPSAFGASRDTFEVLVDGDISDLGAYLGTNHTMLDLLPYLNVYPFPDLSFFCMSNTTWCTNPVMQFDVLCYEANFGSLKGNFSVSSDGAYISPDTVAHGGIVLFDVDTTALQVSHANQALAGVSTVICLIIIACLVKSKWF